MNLLAKHFSEEGKEFGLWFLKTNSVFSFRNVALYFLCMFSCIFASMPLVPSNFIGIFPFTKVLQSHHFVMSCHSAAIEIGKASMVHVNFFFDTN